MAAIGFGLCFNLGQAVNHGVAVGIYIEVGDVQGFCSEARPDIFGGSRKIREFAAKQSSIHAPQAVSPKVYFESADGLVGEWPEMER